MPEPAYDPSYDISIPYYDRTPENRALRAIVVKFADSIGTHLICPRKTCKREAGCADRDPRALPFCWNQYRGMLRFLLFVAAEARGIEPSGSVGPEEVGMPEPFRGVPLLAELAAGGADLASMARSVEDGPDDWDWEAMPEMVALKNRLAREWRVPGDRG